jgi:putative transposase
VRSSRSRPYLTSWSHATASRGLDVARRVHQRLLLAAVDLAGSTLKEAEAGAKSTDLCRRHGEQTFYRWKRQYGGLEGAEARRLRQRKDEHARLKRLVADLTLEK